MAEKPIYSHDKTLKYNPQLDGLRFCAVLLVVSYHWIPIIADASHGFFLGGLVNFFFVLSGYLITSILFSAKEKGSKLSIPRHKVIFGFIIRRAIRIFPAYYFILFVCVLLPTTGEEIRNNSAAYFLYFSNFEMFKHQSWPSITAQFWTLSVEEQFYLVWPLLIIFIPQRYLLKTFFAMITAGIILKIIYYRPVFPVPMSTLTQFSTSGFAIGGILAYKYTYASEKEYRFITNCFNLLFYTGIPVCITVILAKSYYFSFVYNRFLYAVFSMKVIDGAIKGYKNGFGNFLNNRISLYIGKISYGIYLWHLLVPVMFWKLYNDVYAYLSKAHPYFFSIHHATIISFEKILTSDAVCFFIYAVLTVAVAAISWKLIEQPFNKLKSLVTVSWPRSSFTADSELKHTDAKKAN
jgi:peptidoglycan/LPS O-acetylase OafA/YrhL